MSTEHKTIKDCYFTKEELSFISKKVYESACKKLGVEPYSTSIDMDELIPPIEVCWDDFSDLSEE